MNTAVQETSAAARLVEEIQNQARRKGNTFTDSQRRYLSEVLEIVTILRDEEDVRATIVDVFSDEIPPRTPRTILRRIAERLTALPPGSAEQRKPDPNAGLKRRLEEAGVPSYFLRGNREQILSKAEDYIQNYAPDFTQEDLDRLEVLKRAIRKETYGSV